MLIGGYCPCLGRNRGRTIGIRGLSEDVVGRLLVIDVVVAVAALGIWYFLFAAYNRRKGTEALRWVQSACAGKGRILDSRWFGSYRLQSAPSISFPQLRKCPSNNEVPSARVARAVAH